MTERIAAAAIQHGGTGVVYSVPPPGRHHTVIGQMRDLGIRYNDPTCEKGHIQGFVTDTGRFVDREEGHLIAKSAGQIIRRCGGDEYTLYSENLW